MDAGTFTLLLALGSLLAGFLGALTGLGGGVVLVPLLTLAFGVDLRYAIGASLVSVIATSSAAAASYVRDGYSNVRVGMFLEVATTIGAVVGAMIATWVPISAVAIVFGVVLLWSSITSLRHRVDGAGPVDADRIATALRLDGGFPTATGLQTYHVAHVPGGFALMFVAGGLSGLLGIGSGALKVLAGGVLWLRHADGTVVDWRTFRGEPVHLEHVGSIVAAARAGEARAIIQLGILLLIGTPIGRVFFSLVSFALQRDRTYVATTLVVLTVLLWSLVGLRF